MKCISYILCIKYILWIKNSGKKSEKKIVKIVEKGSGYGLNWKIVEKKIVEKGSGYGLNWKIVGKKSDKKK